VEEGSLLKLAGDMNRDRTMLFMHELLFRASSPRHIIMSIGVKQEQECPQ
jgi:hypothetical protein